MTGRMVHLMRDAQRSYADTFRRAHAQAIAALQRIAAMDPACQGAAQLAKNEAQSALESVLS